MFSYIQKLQGRPIEQRKKIAFVIAVFITGVIFMVWFVQLISIEKNPPKPITEESPFSVIKGKIDESIKSFENIFK